MRLPDDYHRLYGIWFACGFPAFAPAPAIIWLMSVRAGNRILIGGNDRKVYTSSTSTTPVTERTAELCAAKPDIGRQFDLYLAFG